MYILVTVEHLEFWAPVLDWAILVTVEHLGIWTGYYEALGVLGPGSGLGDIGYCGAPWDLDLGPSG